MLSYRLSKDAENDLLGIWRYSNDNWGENQADLYIDGLEGVCEKIGAGDVLIVRSIATIHDSLRYCLHERHFVFWLEQANQPRIVIAILHAQMDIVRHLVARINDDVQ